MSQGSPWTGPLQLEGWRKWTGAACAVALAGLFLVAGIWKLSDPLATAERMTQALIPKPLSMAAALVAGIVETWTGVLLLVPRWRKWGAWLAAFSLAVFMAYFAVFYQRLAGADCSCFPWLKRVVGPGFFVSDAAMLVLALGAARWSLRSTSGKQALMAFGAIVVMAMVVFGVTVTERRGVEAPAEILVDGQKLSLRQGRVFVFFFDPECMHCFASAKELGLYRWKGVKVVAAPTVNPHWTLGFLRDTGLKAGVTFDVANLRGVFHFTDPPYGVAIEQGRQAGAFTFSEGDDVAGALRKMGWIE